MDRIRSVVIIGLGALGTLYADTFQRAGCFDVFVLADKERVAAYQKKPRVFRGEEVSFRYVLPEEEGLKADLIMICVKSGGMRQAVDMIGNFVGDDTIIISLMNGVSCEELLIEKYGAEHVVYTIYKGDGVQHLNGKINDVNVNRIYFGSIGNPRDEEQVRLLADFCERAGILYSVEPDMLYTFWHKYAIIIGCNQLCALLGRDYSIFHESPELLEIAKELVRECVPPAKAAGVRNAEKLPDEIASLALSFSPDCYPSIAQDRDMKRRMEVDIFAEEIVKRSGSLGLDAPCNRLVCALLRSINRQNGFKD